MRRPCLRKPVLDRVLRISEGRKTGEQKPFGRSKSGEERI